jgi:regulator of replication initiation timing
LLIRGALLFGKRGEKVKKLEEKIAVLEGSLGLLDQQLQVMIEKNRKLEREIARIRNAVENIAKHFQLPYYDGDVIRSLYIVCEYTDKLRDLVLEFIDVCRKHKAEWILASVLGGEEVPGIPTITTLAKPATTTTATTTAEATTTPSVTAPLQAPQPVDNAPANTLNAPITSSAPSAPNAPNAVLDVVCSDPLVKNPKIGVQTLKKLDDESGNAASRIFAYLLLGYLPTNFKTISDEKLRKNLKVVEEIVERLIKEGLVRSMIIRPLRTNPNSDVRKWIYFPSPMGRQIPALVQLLENVEKGIWEVFQYNYLEVYQREKRKWKLPSHEEMVRKVAEKLIDFKVTVNEEDLDVGSELRPDIIAERKDGQKLFIEVETLNSSITDLAGKIAKYRKANERPLFVTYDFRACEMLKQRLAYCVWESKDLLGEKLDEYIFTIADITNINQPTTYILLRPQEASIKTPRQG